jgi:hypothetical protein
MTTLAYIGPGLGIGTILLVLLTAGIVVFSFGYIAYLKIKQLFKKK